MYVKTTTWALGLHMNPEMTPSRTLVSSTSLGDTQAFPWRIFMGHGFG